MPTLDFKGKSLVYAHHLTVPFRPLEPDAAKSLPPPKPGAISSKNAPKSAPKSGKPSLDDNLIIHGDNLHALKALMPRYAGRVNCIYIDPPYNTGNEKWVYNDNVNSPMMKEWLKGKSPVDGEDLERHDKWLCMMWPRLQLLRELLAEDGVIFISIDDNEQHRLRMMMGEIFGEENFLGQFVWKSRQNKDNRNVTGVSIDHEYVLCYGKCIRGEERKTGQYSNPDNDPRGDWASGNMVGLATKESRPNLHFDLIDPKTENNYGCPVRGWRYDKKRISKLIADDRILWPAVSSGRPRVKTFLNELKEEFTGFSSVIGDNVFTRNGTKEIEEIFAMRVFEFPKSYELVRQLIIQGCQNDGIVLDSFAGSATTAHAVLALNKEDNGNRKFILVEVRRLRQQNHRRTHPPHNQRHPKSKNRNPEKRPRRQFHLLHPGRRNKHRKHAKRQKPSPTTKPLPTTSPTPPPAKPPTKSIPKQNAEKMAFSMKQQIECST